jgi:hypothetical protein
LACGQKKDQNAAATTTSNTPTTATAPAAATTKKLTMKDYFEAYKKKEIDANDSVIVATLTDDFVRFEYFPKSGEIIGTIYMSFGLLKSEGKPDKIISFFHACVEGQCNLSHDNLKVYTTDWKDITEATLPMAEIKKAFDAQLKSNQKDKKNKKYNSFFATVDPDTRAVTFGAINDEDNAMMNGKDSDNFQQIGTVYWNEALQKFTKDYPHAG